MSSWITKLVLQYRQGGVKGITMFDIKDFVRESNKIEGIVRPPSYTELDAHEWFLALTEPSIADLMTFVSIAQPGAVLRNKPGLNAKVGKYVPPLGGAQVEERLAQVYCSCLIALTNAIWNMSFYTLSLTGMEGLVEYFGFTEWEV